MLLWLIRAVYGALILFAASYAYTSMHEVYPDSNLPSISVGLLIILIGAMVIVTDLRDRNKQIATVSAIYFGLLMGLLLGSMLSLGIYGLLSASMSTVNVSKLGPPLYVATTLVCCYVTIATLLQTRDDFRFIIPYVEFSKQVKGNKPFVLDTSVIIDGRIADLCETKLVEARLIVPRFVLNELQGIADSSDKLKRNRGRRGLDMLKRLQTNTKIEMIMHDGDVPELRTAEKIRVDEKLVIFAKSINGKVVTNDFNLNKMAQLQGVDVINLNEVANSLKTVALPGEYLNVKVVKQGDQVGQGIGYLEDGTMVVIEQGRNLIGQDASIMVTSVLQTPAGRMIFGRPEARPSGAYTPVGQSGMMAPVSGPQNTTVNTGAVSPQSTTLTQPVKLPPPLSSDTTKIDGR
jgi:uncharacterized protein YacL